MIPKLKDILPTHILEDAGRPNIHKSGEVWAHKGSEGRYGAEYKGKIEYFYDRDRAVAFAKTGSGYGAGALRADRYYNIKHNKVKEYSTDDSLSDESKKYNSSEEFLKSRGQVYYHGTSKESADSIESGGFDLKKVRHAGSGVHFMKNPEYIRGYNKGAIVKAYVEFKNPMTTKQNHKIRSAIIKKITGKESKDLTSSDWQYYSKYIDTKFRQVSDKMGYDGIITPDHPEVVALHPEQIKTEKQLINIWEDTHTEKVTNIRDYTDDEYDEETGEYFENDDAMKAAPNAFTDEDDMIHQMKTAKPKFLSLNNMRNMNNSDVGDILKAGDKKSMYNKGKELAIQVYGKDWDKIQKGINNPKAKFPAPIALRDKKGSLWLLAGNTRLMSFTAIGKKLPIKIIDYDGEFKTSNN